jgi:DNA processing protein
MTSSATSPAISAEEELHWLALKMVSGLGTRRAGQLIETFRSPEAIFRASRSELEGAGLPGSVAQSISSGCAFEEAVEQQGKMRAAGACLVTINSAEYPPLLREVYDPPVVLYARGKLEILQRTLFAVVGTRRPTPYGIAVAERLAADLSAAGLVITSGMASGIDTASHKGALSVNAPTIAVLGCGVDIVYPSENRKLSEQIAEKGVVLSEFPMGSAAFPQNFPIRNRIVSGACVGLLVVEGAQYSGSAITARLALDQGREIFAVPGNITSKMSWGPNLLIKQGAKLVQDWNDVIVDLPPAVRRRLIDDGKQRLLDLGDDAAESAVANGNRADLAGPESEISRRILQKLSVDTPVHLDSLIEIMERCSTSEVIAALFELEMLGLARQLPGRQYVRKF